MNATKVTFKAGHAYADGVDIGTVERVEHDGLWATQYGIRAGGVEWRATAPDGTVFDGQDRRKDAARLLELHARPLTVSNVKVETDFYTGDRFVSATVEWQGYTAMASRYPHEIAWIVDAYFRPGSFCPVWSNGAGTRYTRAHCLTGEQATAVDAAIAAMADTLTAQGIELDGGAR